MHVDSSSHRDTHENDYELTLTGSSVVERPSVTSNTRTLTIHNSVHTDDDTNIEPQSSVIYPVYDEVGQAHPSHYQTGQATKDVSAINSRQQPSPERNSSLSQIPFSNLVLQPSVGRTQANINGRYEMQELNLYSEPSVVQSSDCQQRLQHAVNFNDQIVVVPTDPVTGYSTMLRTDQVRPNPSQDLAYASSKVLSMMNQDVSRMLLQLNISYCEPASNSQSPSSTSASNILSPTSTDSNVTRSTCPQLGHSSPSHTDTPVVPAADLESETGYAILRDGRPQALTGQERIPIYNTIDLKGVGPPVRVNDNRVMLQANNSYGNAHSSDSQPDPSLTFLKSGASVLLNTNPLISLSPKRASPLTHTQTHEIPTSPETGYSTMLRDERTRPSSSPLPIYDTINSKAKDSFPSVVTLVSNVAKDDSYNGTIPAPTKNVPGQASRPPPTDTKLLSLPETSSALITSVVPTDPKTGYSTMLRPDKFQRKPGPFPGYDVIKVSEDHEESTEEKNDLHVTAPDITASVADVKSLCRNSLTQESRAPRLHSNITHNSTLNPQKISPPSPSIHTQCHVVPTDTETGYSTMLRPDKFQPLPGPVPGYDTIKVKDCFSVTNCEGAMEH